tara:strand:- start:147082 stop:148380 length:1299 start_codon:yes stop_codon:yes gene_type:complete
MTKPLVLRSRRVVLPSGTRAADISIGDGVIQSVDDHGQTRALDSVEDCGDDLILPGLCDTHVHLNDPGRESWEGFRSGTLAARAGGICTVVDMPLNSSPVTTTVAALRQKQAAADGKLFVDVALHAGVIPASALTVCEIIDAGAIAAKAFMCHSGIDEFPATGESDLRVAMQALAKSDVPLLVHAELVHDVPAMTDPRSYADYLATRPPQFERHAIEMLIRLARQTGCHVHIVHLADAGCLPMIADAKAQGLKLTVETCPHYLAFTAEEIQDGQTQFKCAPPIRDAANGDALWQGLKGGSIDMIVSDHSPCPVAMKCLDTGRFDQAWGGVSSLQLGLPIVWTEARRRGFGIEDVVRWMSSAPAGLVGLSSGIAPGQPAHLVRFDCDAAWVVDQQKLLHKNPVTPYHGRQLSGRVVQTWVHGEQNVEPVGKLI